MPFTVNSTYTGAGSGSWTYIDDVGSQVALLTQQVSALNLLITNNFTPAGLATPGTPVAIASVSAVNIGGIWESLADTNKRLQELSTAIVNLEKRMETQTKGMAVMTQHMAKSVLTQQQAYLDQVKNNAFQQQTTNQALADVGKPPTVVTPAAILTKIQSNISDLLTFNAEQQATGVVTNYVTTTISEGYITAETWFLSTALGKFIVESWASIKVNVKSIFSFEWAKEEVDKAKRAANNIKAGDPTNLGP